MDLFTSEVNGQPVLRAMPLLLGVLCVLAIAYREKFGRTPPDVAVELVNLRVTAEAPPRRTFVPEKIGAGASSAPKATRQVYFREAGGYLPTPIYERSTLQAGFAAQGPLLVEDPSSSLVVGPLGRIEQLASGNLVITLQE